MSFQVHFMWNYHSAPFGSIRVEVVCKCFLSSMPWAATINPHQIHAQTGGVRRVHALDAIIVLATPRAHQDRRNLQHTSRIAQFRTSIIYQLINHHTHLNACRLGGLILDRGVATHPQGVCGIGQTRCSRISSTSGFSHHQPMTGQKLV